MSGPADSCCEALVWARRPRELRQCRRLARVEADHGYRRRVPIECLDCGARLIDGRWVASDERRAEYAAYLARALPWPPRDEEEEED